MSDLSRVISRASLVEQLTETPVKKSPREKELEALFKKTAIKSEVKVATAKPLPPDFDVQQHNKLINQKKASAKKIEPTSVEGYKKFREKFA